MSPAAGAGGAGGPGTAGGLCVMAVDDELPALEELAYLLRADPRVGKTLVASSATEALRVLEGEAIDAVFLDIHMPGLDGLDLARILNRFAQRPAIVFVTAYEDHAVDAFELRAADYLMKPMRQERVAEAIRRVAESRGVEEPVSAAAGQEARQEAGQEARQEAGQEAGQEAEIPDESIPVELGGVTRFIARKEVLYVEAQGDYARLHTSHGSHLVRVPLTTLEERWRSAGFVRVHRSHLVQISHIVEVRFDSGRATVRVGETELAVSRRHTRQLRDLLVRNARPGGGSS
jgi:two-component system, LytTR family, response regulator LytT